MTSVNLIERLKADLTIITEARRNVRSQDELNMAYANSVTKSPSEMNYTMEESWISMTCDITLSFSLHSLIPYFNYFDTILTTSNSHKVDICTFREEINNNDDKLISVLDNFIQNQSIVVYYGGSEFKPISKVLKESLDLIHQESMIIYNCHEMLSKK